LTPCSNRLRTLARQRLNRAKAHGGKPRHWDVYITPESRLAELHGALIFINAEAALLGDHDNHLLDMLALRTFERQKVGMGGTRFDPGQHHPALTLKAAWPIDGKQGWVGMTMGFRHDVSPALGGSATLSVTGWCRYEGR
jgi:hypothetical protein